MKMIQFEYWVNKKQKVFVYAKAKSVDSFGPKDMKLHIMDRSESRVELNRECMEEIEEQAVELFMEKQENDQELNFEE